MSKTVRYVKRDYWNMEGTHCPYQNCVHTDADEGVDIYDVVDELLSNLKDGDEFTLTVRATGKRPFGDRRFRLQRPHEYEPETDEQMAERLSSKASPEARTS